jgi:enoyl-CoA hydratase
MSESMNDAEVLVRVDGKVGRLTLNRPKALHSLTLNMCRLMAEALLAWQDDPRVELVLIDHSGERGFCAGGDIRVLYDSAAGDGSAAREFFFTEYRLNELLFRYPKPVAAFIDGVVMGGGVGISMPARFRVATERTTYAMPETGIGLFPDVGGGWWLPRMPDHIGIWLALTGARIKAADCELVGVATDYVESARLEELKAAIVADPAAIERLLTEFEGDPGRPSLAAHQDEIEKIFAGATVEAIVAGLKAADTDWARQQLEVLATKSPQTMKVAFRQLQLGRRAKSFADNMAMEYRIACRVVRRPDFIEGVRAVIVEKDNQPRWNPATLEGVTEALLDEIFAPLPAAEEWTPLPIADGQATAAEVGEVV